MTMKTTIIIAMAMAGLILAAEPAYASVGLLIMKQGGKEIKAMPEQAVQLKLLIANLGTRQLGIRLNVTEAPEGWFVSPLEDAFVLSLPKDEKSSMVLATSSGYVKVREYAFRASIPSGTPPGTYMVRARLTASPLSSSGFSVVQEREIEFQIVVSMPAREPEADGIAAQMAKEISKTVTGLLAGAYRESNILMVILLAALVAVYMRMKIRRKRR